MCGIAGIHGISSDQDTKEIVSQMLEKLAHRGPDAEGIYINQGYL